MKFRISVPCLLHVHIIKSVDLAGLEPALFCFTQMRYLATRAVSQLTSHHLF